MWKIHEKQLLFMGQKCHQKMHGRCQKSQFFKIYQLIGNFPLWPKIVKELIYISIWCLPQIEGGWQRSLQSISRISLVVLLEHEIYRGGAPVHFPCC